VNWWTSLGPELIKAVLMFLFGGGLVSIYRARQADAQRKRSQPYEDNAQLIQLTEKLQQMSNSAVDQANIDLKGLRRELAEMRGNLRRLERYQQTTSQWHVDHVREYDEPAREIIGRVAPDQLDRLKLTPFPLWEDTQ
jgi:hypothetical protein